MTEDEKLADLISSFSEFNPGEYKFPPRNEYEAHTSMLYWYPRLVQAGLPINIPRTLLIDAEYWCLLPMLDGERPDVLASVVRRMRRAGNTFGWPIFLRTDMTSGKHDWRHTCFCPNWRVVPRHVAALVEDTALKDIHFNALAVREFLPLRYGFRAFEDMPIAREFRFFVRDGEVEHVQPYWPEDSIQRPDNELWREILREQSLLDDALRAELTDAAQAVGELLGNYWSVDFAQHADGRWYLIDMARGEVSYRWDPATGEEVEP